MWKNNLDVQNLYGSYGSQAVWASFVGMSGWKRLKTGSADAVGNMTEVLSTAKINGRKVNVFMKGDEIERVIML